MNSFAHAVTKFDDALARGEEWVLIALVLAMSGIVFLQVVFRYVLAQPLQWSEELARYMFVWTTLLGAALGVRNSVHFGVDFFVRMLPAGGVRLFTLLTYLVMLIVIAVLLVHGFILVQKTAAQRSPAMEISMAWAYACVPGGAALMLIHLLSLMVREAIKEGSSGE